MAFAYELLLVSWLIALHVSCLIALHVSLEFLLVADHVGDFIPVLFIFIKEI